MEAAYTKELTEPELAAKIDELLYDLNLPSHFVGYYYLKSAILQTVLCKKKLPDISYGLFAKIAKDFNVDKRHVERAITKAVSYIESLSCRKGITQTILGYEIRTPNSPISAKELIALIADQLRIQYYDYY